MAGNLINTLYPPIADTFMPAFVNTTDGYIYFSLSPYNNAEDITRIHISLIDQKTNHYVFTNVTKPSDDGIYVINGIMIKPFSSVHFNEETGMYYCPIERKFLKTEYRENSSENDQNIGNFKTEVYYQAQVRLDKYSGTIDNAADYILENRQYFSEWSRVILLRPIPEPIIYFNAWDEVIPNADFTVEGIAYENGINGKNRRTILQENFPTYNPGLVPIAGQIYWESASINGANNTEYLDNYKITIYESGDLENPFIETDTIYVGNQERDSIYYLADLNNGIAGANYIIHIDAETRNGYQWWDERTIVLAHYDTTPFDLNWEFTKIKLNTYGTTAEKIVTEEDGYVQGRVTSKQDLPPGYLYIFRSSSIDNFLTNEIIQVTAENGPIDETFEDRTVCSLIQYRYKAQYKLKHGSTWTKVSYAPTFVYPDFYDMLILRQDKQFAIRFDEQIQSLKPIVNRVKIDTLGSKYPRFAENARMNYKQFQISGIVSAESDFNRKFMSEKDEQWVPSLNAYDKNIGNIWQLRNDTLPDTNDDPVRYAVHDTYLHDNWYWEREFREQATAWLNDGEPKLFRSMTEGNMIVMLTDINLTPNRTIGRRLYNFSATAYEIADGMKYNDLVNYGIVIRRDDETEAMKYNGEGSSEEDDGSYTKVERISQYILGENKNLESGENIDMPVVDLLKGQILKIDSPVENWVDPITVKDSLNQQYTGVFDNRRVKDKTIKVRDLRIQFTSMPRWMHSNTLNYVTEDEISTVDMSSCVFGYKFRIGVGVGEYRTIFVNHKGYYQIPSDILITSLLFYYGDTYQLDYILTYQLEYNTTNLTTKTEKIKDIVGQYSGTFYPQVLMGDTIRQKYSYIVYKNNKVYSEESMKDWSSISFDVTPYASIDILEKDSKEYQTRVVGRTGVYNLMTEVPIQDFKVMGRRMVQAPADNRPYLDEWEFVLDESVFGEYPGDQPNYWYRLLISPNPDYAETTDNIVRLGLRGSNEDLSEPYDIWRSLEEDGTLGAFDEESLYGYLEIKNIKNPRYNTIYKIVDENFENPIYVIYYVDQDWYRVIPYDDKFKTVLTQVPIYGVVNYRGTVYKQLYS